uniref:Variant surface glycoprotein 581 n=1 Tax=Trypanosoma brucei TaxID=5691 RepID=M4SYF6_9TRYP|nr:variant surface glycoprotein 581 [Trypanosoma brucei]
MHMFVICLMLVAASGWSARGEKTRECTTSCGCAARIRRRLAAVKAELDADVSANDKNKNDMLQLLVAAITADDDDTKRKVAPVLAAAGKITSQCDDELQAASAAYSNALKLTEQLAAIYSVQHLISSGKGNIEITLATANMRLTGSGYSGVFTLGSVGSQPCKNDTSADDDQRPLHEQGSNSEDKTPKLIDHVNIVGNCQRDNTPGNDCTSKDIGSSAKIKLEMTYSDGAKVKTQTWPNMEALPAVLESNGMDLIGDLADSAHYAIKTLAAQIKNHNCRKDIRTYSAVASEAVYKLLQTKTTAGKEDAESGDELTGNDLKTVKSYRYSDDGKNFKANLWDAADNSPAYLGKQKTEETTQVKKLETLDKVGEASARAPVKHLKKKHASTKKTAKEEQKKEKECSGKKGDNCKGRCELVGDTCKPKAKADGKNAKYERKASTCTGKLEDTCKKNTSCKWENNACENSSFLVNKKFALMVSAFVSLVAF